MKKASQPHLIIFPSEEYVKIVKVRNFTFFFFELDIMEIYRINFEDMRTFLIIFSILLASCSASFDEENRVLDEKNREIEEKIENLQNIKDEAKNKCRYKRDEINVDFVKIGEFNDKTTEILNSLSLKENLSFISINRYELGECFSTKNNIVLFTTDNSFIAYEQYIPFIIENEIPIIYSVSLEENIWISGKEIIEISKSMDLAINWNLIWKDCQNSNRLQKEVWSDVTISTFTDLNEENYNLAQKCSLGRVIWNNENIPGAIPYKTIWEYINNL